MSERLQELVVSTSNKHILQNNGEVKIYREKNTVKIYFNSRMHVNKFEVSFDIKFEDEADAKEFYERICKRIHDDLSIHAVAAVISREDVNLRDVREKEYGVVKGRRCRLRFAERYSNGDSEYTVFYYPK